MKNGLIFFCRRTVPKYHVITPFYSSPYDTFHLDPLILNY